MTWAISYLIMRCAADLCIQQGSHSVELCVGKSITAHIYIHAKDYCRWLLHEMKWKVSSEMHKLKYIIPYTHYINTVIHTFWLLL